MKFIFNRTDDRTENEGKNNYKEEEENLFGHTITTEKKMRKKMKHTNLGWSWSIIQMYININSFDSICDNFSFEPANAMFYSLYVL